VGYDVLIDNETLLVTDFMNLKINLTQSFEGTHRVRMCVRVFIGVSARTCMSIYVSKKIVLLLIYLLLVLLFIAHPFLHIWLAMVLLS
jgi:hypothetical protein